MTITRKLSPLIGFHGCKRAVAEDVLAGKNHLNASVNSFDWLGSGIYFWVESFARAMDWAESNYPTDEPYVVDVEEFAQRDAGDLGDGVAGEEILDLRQGRGAAAAVRGRI